VTAEVAILNKLGVALAADSAVTIGQGGTSKKVFNTADKLFELSCKQPIGCMIFSGGQFMEAPLPVLIKEFRAVGDDAPTVRALSLKLLEFFQCFADKSPDVVKTRPIVTLAYKITSAISKRFQESLSSRVTEVFEKKAEGDPLPDVNAVIGEVWESSFRIMERYVTFFPEVKFLGQYPKKAELAGPIGEGMDAVELKIPQKFRERLHKIVEAALKRATPYSPSTGIVVAGFGKDEIFPTLVHVDLFDTVLGSLKYLERQVVDIDRQGARARVLAFAQSEMAERFLFGLDARLKTNLARFAQSTVSSIGQAALDHLDFEDEAAKTAFQAALSKAEAAFVREFENSGMESIRLESQRAVEEMVEFMPKQDLAEFAEALVNLSSVQRRVTSGFETVGGPIDVAVISKSEGLVWVKRKHYFSRDLNYRFFERMGGQDARRPERSRRAAAPRNG
jgi:hypothetical protein